MCDSAGTKEARVGSSWGYGEISFLDLLKKAIDRSHSPSLWGWHDVFCLISRLLYSFFYHDRDRFKMWLTTQSWVTSQSLCYKPTRRTHLLPDFQIVADNKVLLILKYSKLCFQLLQHRIQVCLEDYFCCLFVCFISNIYCS